MKLKSTESLIARLTYSIVSCTLRLTSGFFIAWKNEVIIFPCVSVNSKNLIAWVVVSSTSLISIVWSFSVNLAPILFFQIVEVCRKLPILFVGFQRHYLLENWAGFQLRDITSRHRNHFIKIHWQIQWSCLFVAPQCASGFCRLFKYSQLVDLQVINLHTQVTPVLRRLGWGRLQAGRSSWIHRYGKPCPIRPQAFCLRA